jgi:hypothetical protein
MAGQSIGPPHQSGACSFPDEACPVRKRYRIACHSSPVAEPFNLTPLPGNHDWERRSNSPRKRLNTAASSGFNSCKWCEISESALTRSV